MSIVVKPLEFYEVKAYLGRSCVLVLLYYQSRIKNYQIQNGTRFTITGTWTSPTSYATLQEAMDAANAHHTQETLDLLIFE